MDKYNLTFNGEILPGLNLAEVKQRFAKALLIDDPARVEHFFSGDVITLRRNLEKEAAEAFYTKMHRIGVLLKLEPAQKKKQRSKPAVGMNKEFRHESAGSIDQSWPVSAARSKAKKNVYKKGNAIIQAEEQQRKKAAEEAARIKAEELAARKKAEEEEARRKAKENEARKIAAAEAARIKAEELAARKKAEEEEARRKAEENEARKIAAAEAARIKAEELAARKKAEEEEARRKAEENEARKIAAAEAARIKAEELAARKKAEEEEARRKAEENEARKIAAAEAARIKAEELAARKKAREAAVKKRVEELAIKKAAKKEAARIKAAEFEAKKQAKKVAAKKQAEDLAAKKAAEEEASRVRAELERKQNEKMARAKAEDKRIRAETAARKKAEEEALKQKVREQAAKESAERAAAEEAAIQQALEEIVRKKLEEEARIQHALELAARQQAEQKEASLRARLVEQKRLHAEQAARAKSEEEQIENALRELAKNRKTEQIALEKKKRQQQRDDSALALAKRQEDERLREDVEKHKAIEQQLEREALQRAAEGTARLAALQTPPQSTKEGEPESSSTPAADQPGKDKASNKTKSVADESKDLQTALARHRKNLEPAAPNIFNLHAFRNTVEIRQRAEKSSKIMRVMYLTSIVCLLILSILAVRFELQATPQPVASGADTVLTDQHSGLIVAAGANLFTLDRAGVETGSVALNTMGLSPGVNLVGFDASGGLIVQQPSTSNTEDNSGSASWRALRCELETPACLPYSAKLPEQRINAWTVNPRTKNSFLTTPTSNRLTKLSADGTVLGQAELTIPAQASLVLNEGLLYLNSGNGPAIGIFRLDDKGFGQQLDEVLLLPPPAQETNQTQVGEFVHADDSWWVILKNPGTGDAGVYRFDAKWNYLSAVSLASTTQPEHLLSWADKILVVDPHMLPIQRFNLNGQAEAPIIPKALQLDIDNQQRRIIRSDRLWQISLGLLALLGTGSYLLGRLQQLRVLVYRRDKIFGADSIDDKAQQIHWIEFYEFRRRSWTRLAIIFGLICLTIFVSLVLFLVALNVIIAAALLMLGPTIALSLLHFSRPGHIGVWRDQLVLVDHHNNYHLGGGSRIRHWGNFLLLDDIVVFTGSRYLHVFSPRELATRVAPLARAGVQVDATTVIIKLIQASHPIAQGMAACFACVGAAVVCLLLF